jgi:hypothetical protein
MSDLESDPRVQAEPRGKGALEVSDSKLLQEDADEMGEKAIEEEKRYDEEHGIFSK